MSRFINAELKSDSESDSEAGSKSDTELMASLQSGSNFEWHLKSHVLAIHFCLVVLFLALSKSKN